jgi:hypothetical protein
MAENTYSRILSCIRRVERRYIFVGVAEAFSAAAAVFVGLFLLFGLAESHEWFSPRLKTALFASVFVLSSLAFLVIAALAFLRRPDEDGLARMVERRYPGLGDRLISAVQLGRLGEAELRGQSRELVCSLVDRVEREIGTLPLERAVPTGRLVFLFRTALGAAALFLLLVIFFPESVTSGFCRLADYSREYVRPGAIVINTALGDVSIIRGENFSAKGFLNGKPAPLTAYYRWKGASSWISKPVEVNVKSGAFTLQVEKPRLSFAWYLESGSHRTPRSFVTVIERPVVEKLEITLTHPSNTGLGAVTRSDNDGSVRAVRGTRVLLKVTANKPLARMSIHWSDSTVAPCAVKGAVGTAEFTVTRDIDYRLSLLDSLGIGDVNPITYRVSCLDDEYPKIAVLSPGADAVLTRSMILPVAWRATDDYGITEVSLSFMLPFEDRPRIVKLKTGRLGPDVSGQTPWDLSALNLLPDDRVKFFLAAWDNDAVRGPKKGVSDTLTVRVPSLTDIMRDTAADQNADMDRFRDIREKSGEKDRALEEVQRRIEEGKKTGWNERNAVEESKKNLEEMQRGLKQFSNDVKEMAGKLGEQDLAALETVEKLKKIADMMNEIADGDIKEALKKLAQAQVELDPRAMKKALEQYQVNADAIKKKLDNMIALLEQVKSIQRFDLAKKALEDIAARQAELAQKLRNTPDSKELARAQEALAAEMKKLRTEIEAAVKDLSARFSLNTSQVEEYLSKENIEGGMGQTAGNLEKGERGNAKKGMDESNKKLSELLGRMDALGSAMKGVNREVMRDRILSAATEVLALSNSEGKLLGEFPGKPPDVLAKRQIEIVDGFGKAERSLSALGAVSLELSKVVDQISASIRATLKSSVDQLASGNAKGGELASRSALGMMNRTVLFLAGLLKESNDQAQGKGMAGDLMQQLQMIASGQQSLQSQTGQSGSPELLQRLAAEQQKLAEMLSQLGRKASDDKRLREMLDKIAGDMDQTANMMRRNEPREKIERSQLDIYRRLLDARRSKQERDEETPERKSFTAKKNESKGAERLDPTLGERNALVNERMKRAMEDDFDPAFRNVIRRYFESMLGEGAVSVPDTVRSGTKPD